MHWSFRAVISSRPNMRTLLQIFFFSIWYYFWYYFSVCKEAVGCLFNFWTILLLPYSWNSSSSLMKTKILWLQTATPQKLCNIETTGFSRNDQEYTYSISEKIPSAFAFNFRSWIYIKFMKIGNSCVNIISF